MSIERSHGKARPTLPRASDLRVVDAEAHRNRNHGSDGRWQPGNTGGAERGLKGDVYRLLGRDATGDDGEAVSREAIRVYRSALRSLPSSGELVRRCAARVARHSACETFYADKALDAGLDTEQGMKLEQRASYHGERAERCTVTLLDIAGALAKPSRRSRATRAPAKANVHAAIEKAFGGK